MRTALTKESLDKCFGRLLAVSVSLLLASCALLVPAFRDLVISLAERALGRPLTREVWHGRMVRAEAAALLFLSAFSLYFLSFRRTRFREGGGPLPLFGPARLGRPAVVALACAFAVSSLFRFYWLSQKSGFHEDELYSIGICNRNKGVYGFWGRELEAGRAYTGAEITEGAYFDSASPLDVANDVLHLWVDTKDSPHTNVYYILLRVWFSLKRTADFKEIFVRAGLLNYVFFACSFLLFVRLALLYTRSAASLALLALVAFCNPASVGISVFIRPYALQETALVFFSYLFARYCALIKGGAHGFPLSLHAKSVLVVALLLLSGYFCTFFAAILGGCLLALLAARRDRNSALYFVSMFLGAVAVSKIAYLRYGAGFFEGRGTEALLKLSDRAANAALGAAAAADLISRNLLSFRAVLGAAAGGLAAAALLRARRGREEEVFFSQCVLSLAAVAFSLVVLFFAPVKLLRYVASAFPVIALALAPCATNRKVAAAFVVLEALAALHTVRRTFPSEKNRANIEHLDDSDPQCASAAFRSRPEIPVFVKSDFYAVFVVPYLNGEQTYILVDDIADAEARGFPEYYFIDYQFGTGFRETLVDNTPHGGNGT